MAVADQNQKDLSNKTERLPHRSEIKYMQKKNSFY